VLTVSGLDQSAVARPLHTAAPPSPVFVNAQPCSDYYGQKVANSLPTFNGAHVPYTVCGYTPDQLQSAYDLKSPINDFHLDGYGQTVAIVDAFDSPTIRQDANIYAAVNGQPTYAPNQFVDLGTPEQRTTDGGMCDAQGWYGEQSLDVEAVHAMAPGAQVVYVGANSCQFDDMFNALAATIDLHLADIVSNSWGGTGEDPAMLKPYNDLFVQAALQGTSVLFSSGDSGDGATASWLGVPSLDTPADSPWATAVGGTSTAIDAQGKRTFETGWGTAKSVYDPKKNAWAPEEWLYGAGGGTSTIVAQPWYQRGVVPDSLSADATGGRYRTAPDIAMNADPTTGMVIGQTQTFPDGTVAYSQYRIGGTSLASPLFAGELAIANQIAGKPFGFANPAIYALNGTNAINDVLPNKPLAEVRVDFTNKADATGGYTITLRKLGDDGSLKVQPGYDRVTGVGTPSDTFIWELNQAGRLLRHGGLSVQIPAASGRSLG
jgi:subtilase family serine protease